MDRLILGDGMLGSELVRQTGWDYVSRKKDGIDFTDFRSYRDYLKDYDEVINCIGYVNTYDTDRTKHWDINYKGVDTLVRLCNLFHQKLIHISSDYVYSNSVSNASENDVPVHCRNWYGYTKLLSDGIVQLNSDNFLLIRTSFKEKPCKHSKGWMIEGNFDYVDVISKKIVDLVNTGVDGIYNLGTDKKTLFELGKQTNVNIQPTTEYIDESVPEDVSMNLTKLKSVL
tara:strand:+ start:659 stop:1342 length:684 start_codon:yes stop_codon:yes gene_type:complete